jgi:streptomycin 6-kinase
LIEAEPLTRIQHYAREWSVSIGERFETETSVIAFGVRRDQSVVLKVIKQTGDEWRSGEILAAFNGNGVVRVYEHAPGAALVERLSPGNSLAEISLGGRDEEATNILADVIRRMSARSSASQLESPVACPTVHDWARGFESYLATGDERIPRPLVLSGQRAYLELCASQREPHLLHGDLQHYNVLYDSDRGWLAIDPKGVIGELEYEIGACLRNPYENPELFISRSTIERRLEQFTNRLNLDYERTLRWGFAQAVLSAIWLIEDGFAVDETTPSRRLAEVIGQMLATED